jgi:hypothetical protein
MTHTYAVWLSFDVWQAKWRKHIFDLRYLNL